MKNGYWTFGFLASQRYVFLSLFSIQFFPFFWALAHWMRDTCGQISRVVRQRLSVGVCVTLTGGGAILISGGWYPVASKYLGIQPGSLSGPVRKITLTFLVLYLWAALRRS